MIKNLALYCIDVVMVLLLIALYLSLMYFTKIEVINATYTMQGGKSQAFEHPLKIRTDAKELIVEMDILLPRLHSNHFHIVPDDCLTALWVNDSLVVLDKEICWQRGASVNLKQHLRSGENHLKASITDKGGYARFKIMPSLQTDPLYLVPTILLVIGIFFYGYFRLR